MRALEKWPTATLLAGDFSCSRSVGMRIVLRTISVYKIISSFPWTEFAVRRLAHHRGMSIDQICCAYNAEARSKGTNGQALGIFGLSMSY